MIYVCFKWITKTQFQLNWKKAATAATVNPQRLILWIIMECAVTINVQKQPKLNVNKTYIDSSMWFHHFQGIS